MRLHCIQVPSQASLTTTDSVAGGLAGMPGGPGPALITSPLPSCLPQAEALAWGIVSALSTGTWQQLWQRLVRGTQCLGFKFTSLFTSGHRK